MCNSQKKGLSTKSLNGQTIIDATDALDADSDHESSPRLEDYLEPFAGRTVRGALDGSAYAHGLLSYLATLLMIIRLSSPLMVRTEGSLLQARHLLWLLGIQLARCLDLP